MIYFPVSGNTCYCIILESFNITSSVILNCAKKNKIILIKYPEQRSRTWSAACFCKLNFVVAYLCPIVLYIDYGCFHAKTLSELSSWERDLMVSGAEDIYHLGWENYCILNQVSFNREDEGKQKPSPFAKICIIFFHLLWVCAY